MYGLPWYEMPLSFQNRLRCAISSAQNGAVLKMGPMNEFDFETASHVITFLFGLLNCFWVLPDFNTKAGKQNFIF